MIKTLDIRGFFLGAGEQAAVKYYSRHKMFKRFSRAGGQVPGWQHQWYSHGEALGVF